MRVIAAIKPFFCTMLAIASLSMVLTACSRNPVLEDLENFDKTGAVAFRNAMSEMRSLQQKMSKAQTNEERAALMGEILVLTEEKAKVLNTFKAKTPEVQSVMDLFGKSMTDSVSAEKQAQAAILANDQTALNDATVKLRAAQLLAQQGASRFAELAKQNGYKSHSQAPQ